MSEKVTGYIVMNRQGGYLAQEFHWYNHDSPTEAFVHLADSIESVCEKFRHFLANKHLRPQENPLILPFSMIPATWSAEEGVVITGERVAFPELG